LWLCFELVVVVVVVVLRDITRSSS